MADHTRKTSGNKPGITASERSSDLEEFDEHLLVCAPCRGKLAAPDAWLMTIRSAAVELERQPRAAAESSV